MDDLQREEPTEHEPESAREDDTAAGGDEDYDASVERKYRRRRIAPAWFVGASALALAGGFSLMSAMRDQNVDLSAPLPLPRKIRPTATPVPPAPPLPTASPEQEAAIKQVMARADAWAAKSFPDAPQPALVVCEPTVSDAVPQRGGAQDFGDGCARWLHLNASGEPSLGGTPLWHRVEYARLSIADSRGLSGSHRKAFRAGASDVAALYRATGAARIAVGSLKVASASPLASAVLSYEVWDAPSGRRVASLSIAGTRATLAQRLPMLARRLHASTSTGKGAVDIPPRCELSSGELETIGTAPWTTWNVGTRGEEASDAQIRALERLAPRSALAALEVLHDYPYTFGDARYNAAQAHLLRLAPRNPLAWGAVACLNTLSLHARRGELNALSRRFPRSVALSLAQAYQAQETDDLKGAYAWSGRALHLAPRDPVCWRSVGQLAANQADQIRYGRYSGQISSSEWAVLEGWYEAHLLCDARAASLDGRDGRTWEALCNAATFSSDRAVAQSALWRGLALDAENEGLCGWALQMLQPKWNGDHAQMTAIITHIERTRPLFERLHGTAIQALANAAGSDAAYTDEGSQMLNRTVNRLGDEARLEPERPEPHLYLAHIAKRFGLRDTQYGTALREFGLYLKLRPWDAQVHYTLAWMLHYKTKQLGEARREYEEALRIKPEFPEALSDYIELLTSQRSPNAALRRKARTMLKRALKIQNWASYHVQMGRCLLDEGDRAGARREAQNAFSLGYKQQDRLFTALGMGEGLDPDTVDMGDEEKHTSS